MSGFSRWLGLALVAFVGLQLFFLLRIATMALWAPQSTSFERTQMWRLWQEPAPMAWRAQWVSLDAISAHLQRAIMAAEDDSFLAHHGVDWASLERAWQRNQQAQLRARPTSGGVPKDPRLVGGSTITQQLAKNLLLSGERTLLRKGQELVLTFMLEACLSKRRILELYLNHVEWGSGVFGAQAAARHYFQKDARALSAWEAARLAVMLPRPRHYERLPQSPFLTQRAQAVLARMAQTPLP